MNITNFYFEKKIKKIKNQYYIELYLPLMLNNISYKIYGDKNFIFTGKLKLYNENNINNILIIPINKVQNIFILIINDNNNKNEYYDFINMKNYLNECFFKKNIKLNITKKINDINCDKEDSEDSEEEEDSDKEEDSNKEEDSDKEEEDSDKEEEDSDKEDSDEEEDNNKILNKINKDIL